MTETEKALRDAIVDLARMMIHGVDPREVTALFERMKALDTDKQE